MQNDPDYSSNQPQPSNQPDIYPQQSYPSASPDQPGVYPQAPQQAYPATPPYSGYPSPGSFQPLQAPPPPPTPRKRRRWPWVVGAIIVVFIIIVALASQGQSQSNTPAPTATSQTQAQATQAPATRAPAAPTPTPAPTFAHFGDGTFTVGKDIQPGTYRTRAGSPGCYWARLSGFGGTLGEIIANDTTNDPTVVTIAASDKGFESNGCGTWTKDLSAITSSKTSFANGTFIVGTDMEPGTYKTSGQDGCYWARLSGFGGTVGDIIANDNPSGAVVVTIAASDKGFQSKGCGTWTKE